MDNIKHYINTSAHSEHLNLAATDIQHPVKLTGLLQTSLEIDSVINYFLHAVKQTINYDSAQYTFDEQKINLKLGRSKRHRCSFRLRLADEMLGELIFTRQKRFLENEIEKIENLLSQLIYPLRNSIWYQRALQTAKFDTLTGAHNRSAMDEVLQREVDLANRCNTALSLIIFDLDHFKLINDNYGHTTGDSVLRECVECCTQTLRGSDLIFRFGGEEFVILLTGVNASGAAIAAERLRSTVEKHVFKTSKGTVPVTISVGAASLTVKESAKTIFDRADKALYSAKNSGRNCVECAEQINNSKTARINA